MEAIVRYADGLEYIQQIPTEFLTEKVIDLRIQLKLNITNCHISLREYNYALKKVDEIFPMKTPPPTKCYYFRCIALMNLGEFDKAEDDLQILVNLLPSDNVVKKLKEDFVKLKDKTLKSIKEIFRKGIFSSHLYEDTDNKDNKHNINTNLPQMDLNNNKCFYIDLIVNDNLKNPQKLKFEIFKYNDDKISNIIDLLLKDIKNKSFVKKCNINLKNNCVIVLKEYTLNEEIEIIENNFNCEAFIYPPYEDYLLILQREKVNDTMYSYSIVITTIKQGESDIVSQDKLVIGRCYYNTEFLKEFRNNNSSLESESATINIMDCDFAYNI
jgi:tetratricopeptide (TPR) repeat protein